MGSTLLLEVYGQASTSGVQAPTTQSKGRTLPTNDCTQSNRHATSITRKINQRLLIALWPGNSAKTHQLRRGQAFHRSLSTLSKA